MEPTREGECAATDGGVVLTIIAANHDELRAKVARANAALNGAPETECEDS